MSYVAWSVILLLFYQFKHFLMLCRSHSI